MARIYVTETDTDHDQHLPGEIEPQRRAGFFDPDKATSWHGETKWDGNNNIDINAGRHNHQILYRTAQGRWVLHEWSQWQGTTPSYVYLTPEAAREWLEFNHEDDAVKEFFGPIEDERGPGRPEIGGRVTLALGDVLAKLDAHAAEHGIARAEAARKLLESALG